MKTTLWLLSRHIKYGRRPHLRFGQVIPDLPHSTNPLSMARLSIRVETEIGSRSIVTSAIPRSMASAIVNGLAKMGVHADVRDDRGTHTVAELVKRQRRKVARASKKPTAQIISMSKGRGP